MHLSERGYLVLALIGALCIAGIWSGDALLEGAWRLPLFVVLLGLLSEGWLVRQLSLRLSIETPARLLLGRATAVVLRFDSDSARPLQLEFLPMVPAAFGPLDEPRRVHVAPRAVLRSELLLQPQLLGRHRWPAIPGRVLGRFGLAWWDREWDPAAEVDVAPDLLRGVEWRARGAAGGLRARATAGTGVELLQLRGYRSGDPLSRVDWKGTARRGAVVVREHAEEQHLEILLLVDAGRLSRIRAGNIDRLGVYTNLAARFAQSAVQREDRVGVIVYSDRIHAERAPQRGMQAVLGIRAAFADPPVEASESDPIVAALQARRLLRRRALVVLLTDLEDATSSEQLLRAVRLMSPPHLVLVAGVRGEHIEAVAHQPATHWRDPWYALAAEEQLARIAAQQQALRLAGVPLVVARQALLEEAVLREYQALRQRHRI